MTRIKVRCPDASPFFLEIDLATYTVLDAHVAIRNECGVEPEDQVIFHKGDPFPHTCRDGDDPEECRQADASPPLSLLRNPAAPVRPLLLR